MVCSKYPRSSTYFWAKRSQAIELKRKSSRSISAQAGGGMGVLMTNVTSSAEAAVAAGRRIARAAEVLNNPIMRSILYPGRVAIMVAMTTPAQALVLFDIDGTLVRR